MNTIYEFQGCFWQVVQNVILRIGLIQYFNLIWLNYSERLLRRTRKLGYNLVEIYGCELSKNPAFKKYCKTNNLEFVRRLNPRDAFFGVRTKVTKLRYDLKPGEKGRYVDFVSLYRTVQYFKTYPVGHPVKIHNPRTYDPKWFGFVQCKIGPPRGLYHPVLPVRLRCGQSDKLLLPLCRTCAITTNVHLQERGARTKSHSPLKKAIVFLKYTRCGISTERRTHCFGITSKSSCALKWSRLHLRKKI